MKGITRIEYEGVATRGWMVRLRRAEMRNQKFFGDRTYGGKTKALKAAKECYEEWLAEAPPVKTTRDQVTARNSTGVVGVHLVRNLDSRWANAESFGYCASWITEDGQRQKLSFAWTRYGKKTAWELACLARENQMTDREEVLALYERGAKTKAKSMTKSKPATKAKPAAKVKPAASKKSIKKATPATKAKAGTKAKVATKAKPLAKAKPKVKAKTKAK